MAKKPKIESVLSRETRLKAEADALAAAEKAAEDAKAEAAAEKLRRSTPAVKAVRPKKVKKPRFVREAVEKTPESKAAPLPERSTSAGGKMMTKNVAHVPKDEPNTGPKPKNRPRP